MKRIGLPIFANAFPATSLKFPVVPLLLPCGPEQRYQYSPDVAAVSKVFPDRSLNHISVHCLFNIFFGNRQAKPWMIVIISDG